MPEYTIKGDHPIFRRIGRIAITHNGMMRDLEELLEAGYQVTVEKLPKSKED